MELWIGAAALAAAAASGIALGGLRDVPPRQTERKLLLLRWALAAAIGTDVGALLLLARRLAASGGALWQAALAALLTAPLTAPAGEGTPPATTPPKEAIAAPRPPAVIVRTGHKW